MKKNARWVAIVAGLMIAGVAGWIIMRNRLVYLDEQVQTAWAQVENVYQRRLDLIPNLVATVKGYASHEQETLEKVVQARAQATQSQAVPSLLNQTEDFEKFQQSQAALSSALSRLLVVVERYPDLKANQNFLELQAQLEGAENRIAVERMRFNEAAKAYNVRVRSFPSSWVASLSGFKTKPYFRADAAASQAPKVDFNSKP